MEFDRYATDYDAGMSHPWKRLAGSSPEQFLAVKLRWLLHDFQSLERIPTTPEPAPLTLLDCGCGTGTFLKLLHHTAPYLQLFGCDVSRQMLEEAKRLLSMKGQSIALDSIDHNILPHVACRFDVVVLCCVLHHTAGSEREQLLREAFRVLKHGGRLYVFEHNPWNPITRYVVATTGIDSNAALMTARTVRRCFRDLGIRALVTRYLMFLPPRWIWFHTLDNYLSCLPCGGQYVVRGIRP